MYHGLFPAGYKYLERIVVVGLAQTQDSGILGKGIHVYSVPTMVRMIVQEIGVKDPAKAAVPETYPLLRALQFGAAFGGLAPQVSSRRRRKGLAAAG